MTVGQLDLHGKKGRKIVSIQMPQYRDTNKDPALMWFFLSWNQKLKDWPRERKLRYAKEIGKISLSIPIHMVDFKRDKDAVKGALKDSKFFGYRNDLFVMYDERGVVISEMSGLKLYALFAYLVDSLSVGLQDQDGFDFVKMAKKVMELERGKKKK